MKRNELNGLMHGSEIAQAFDAHLDDVRQGPEDLGELHAVIAGAGLGDGGVLAGPGELAAIDDDAADGGAVAAHELGGRVHDDVRAVLDGAAQVGRGHGVVDDQGHAGLVRDLGHRLDIQHVHARIGDGLAVEARVFGVMALRKFSGSSGSTNLTSMPKRRKLTSNCV